MTLDAFAAPFIYVEQAIWSGLGTLLGLGLVVGAIYLARWLGRRS